MKRSNAGEIILIAVRKEILSTGFFFLMAWSTGITLLLFLLDFLFKITLTLAFQLGLVAVIANVFGDELFIQIVTPKHKNMAEVL